MASQMATPSEPNRTAASLPPTPTIGWIGLGEMGLPMAANLVACRVGDGDVDQPNWLRVSRAAGTGDTCNRDSVIG